MICLFFLLVSSFVGNLSSSYIFVHYTLLHFKDFHMEKTITNKYIPLITKIIFRIVIVADCKSTIQFLQLGVLYTGVYLCCWSDRVLYKRRILLNVLLCCRGWVALLFVVSDGHDTKNCALLVYYTGSSGKFLPTFRDNLSIGPNNLSCTAFHSQKNCIHWTSSSLRMGPIACSETSVRNYHSSLLNNAEEGSPHILRGGSLKPCIVMTLPIKAAPSFSYTTLLLGLCLYNRQVIDIRS